MQGNSHFKEGYTKEIKISKLTNFTFRLIKKYEFLRNFKMFAKYKIIMSLPKKGKVLDVGCGDGINLKVINFLRPDLELYGVDISDKKKFLSKNINFEIMSGDNLSYRDNTFDLVLSYHVLEHVFNAQDFVDELERVLKIKGKSLIETPYSNCILFPGEDSFYRDPTHFRPFTKRSLRRMIEINGNLDILLLDSFRMAKLPWHLYLILFPYLVFKRSLMMSILNLFLKNQVLIIAQKKIESKSQAKPNSTKLL